MDLLLSGTGNYKCCAANTAASFPIRSFRHREIPIGKTFNLLTERNYCMDSTRGKGTMRDEKWKIFTQEIFFTS